MPTLAARRPAVLVHCPRASVDQGGGWVDLTYLRELHEHGFEVDFTDEHGDLDWERLQRYDVLVIYSVPLEAGGYYDNTPDHRPYRDEFIGLVERFLDAGGGVLLMARSFNADDSFLPLIRPWGARIPHERIVDDDAEHLAPLPRMGGAERLWFTDNVAPSPISAGVQQVWLPLSEHYAAAATMPIQVSPDWQVVLRGASSSHTVPRSLQGTGLLPPPEPLVRPGGVREPPLLAVRDWHGGRIAFCAIWPQYSLGQGTAWLYERRVLSAGQLGRRSDFGRLLENALRWLAERHLDLAVAERYVTDPERLLPPNLRPGVREQFVRLSLAASRGARSSGLLHRGLIGVRGELGSGHGSVEGYARAARRAGLEFLVFIEDFARLDRAKLERLKAECAKQSRPDLQLYPGYAIETNSGSRMFLFGRGVDLPPPELVAGGRLNQQFRDPRTGEWSAQSPYVDWISYRMIASGQVNIGYYGFSDRPHAPTPHDLRFFSLLALRLYRHGRLVEDNLAAYLDCAASGLPPAPVSVHFVDSPAELERVAATGSGMTWAQARSVDALWSSLGYAGAYAAPNVFTSDGPLIEAWPAAAQYYTFAAEDFVAQAARMPSPIAVTSSAGLREVRLYDGDRLFRRFLCQGVQRFERVLELTASVARTLVLVAEDVRGARAVSNARRAWKGGELTPVFCGDRVNHCASAPLLARGPGIFQVSRIPLIAGGETWDGGPQGERPILRFGGAERPQLVSSLGREGENGFDNRPFLELADEGAVRVGAVLDRLYDPRIPVVNPWATFGPLDGHSSLFDSQLALTAFDRPEVGAQPASYPGFSIERGAEVSLFENRITFQRAQAVRSLQLFVQQPYRGPFPVLLAHGRGRAVLATYDLTPGARTLEELVVARGEWIGCAGPADTNTSVHWNRGDALRLRFAGRDVLTTTFFGDLASAELAAGEERHYELLSAVDPVDASTRGIARVEEVIRRLHDPGVVPLAGRALERDVAQDGLVELEVEGGVAALRVERPKTPADVPIPVRVAGLSPRWTAGVFQRRGYVLGNYGDGVDRWREAGLDGAGRLWLALYPDLAQVTEVVVGHPVVADHDELFVQVTRLDERAERTAWHVSVNNPTDRELRTTLRRTMELPGFPFAERTVVVPAGGYLVVD